MGRRDRERIARIQAGEEESIAKLREKLSNSLTRTAVKLASRGKVVETLKQASTPEQVEVLNSLPSSKMGKVGRAIMKKAPSEMDKGIKRLQGWGQTVTVEALMKESRETPGFLDMCARAGITEQWFEDLARERMKKAGIAEG